MNIIFEDYQEYNSFHSRFRELTHFLHDAIKTSDVDIYKLHCFYSTFCVIHQSLISNSVYKNATLFDGRNEEK